MVDNEYEKGEIAEIDRWFQEAYYGYRNWVSLALSYHRAVKVW